MSASSRFTLFCIACFLLSISYGATFLLSLLVHSFGGNQRDAGQVWVVKRNPFASAWVLTSLAYFIGVFGFPFVAGKLISHAGVQGMLVSVGVIAAMVWLVSGGRWVAWKLGSRT